MKRKMKVIKVFTSLIIGSICLAIFGGILVSTGTQASFNTFMDQTFGNPYITGAALHALGCAGMIIMLMWGVIFLVMSAVQMES